MPPREKLEIDDYQSRRYLDAVPAVRYIDHVGGALSFSFCARVTIRRRIVDSSLHRADNNPVRLFVSISSFQ